MPGKVLIIDAIATNRIVLKVKLAAACYQVAQAPNGAEGLAMAQRLRPDLILCAAHLPDMEASDFARALRRTPGTRAISLVVEMIEREPELRHDILSAGADDLLFKPCDERLLLARLRSLLRLRETEEELNLREGASRALGLAEEPEGFARPGRIAVITPSSEAAVTLRARLERHLAGGVTALPMKEALRRIDEEAPPDAVAMLLNSESAEAGLQLLADLRAKAQTRDIGVLVLIEGPMAQKLAVDALDRGASDVMIEGFSGREIALRLTRQIARKHRLDQLRSDMRDGLRAALTDPLTGLFNRRYAMPRLAKIAQAAVQSGRDFAAMSIDVDHFKLINDRFGHAAGDAVLMQLAELLRSSVAEQDLVARIGGEEFLIALPETSRSAAQMAAKRICNTVRDAVFPVPGRDRPLQVTVSIGVALLSDVRSTGAAAAPGAAPVSAGGSNTAAGAGEPALHQQVLEQADKALYGAKAHGRNQVTLCKTRSAA